MTKATKEEAGYIDPPPKRLHAPKGKGIRCGTCKYFGKKHECYVVSGEILAQGCCNLWTLTGKDEYVFASGSDIEDIILVRA
jgi:hypothetical protein